MLQDHACHQVLCDIWVPFTAYLFLKLKLVPVIIYNQNIPKYNPVR